MKRLVFTLLLSAVLPSIATAQDDMYFSPKQSKREKTTIVVGDKSPKDNAGSPRDVDEYNRRGLGNNYKYVTNDSLTNDIICFDGVDADSAYSYDDASCDIDYNAEWDYNSRLNRWRYFDDLWFYDPWIIGTPSYYASWYDYYGYGWGWPYRYGWYGGWYSPWYSTYWTGWYDPWFSGWYKPYFGVTVAHNPYNGGVSGTTNHGWAGNPRYNRTNFSGYRGSTSTNRRNTDAYNRQGMRNTNNSGYRRNNRNNNEFGENRTIRTREYDSNSTYRNNSSFNTGSSVNRGGGFSGGNNFGGGRSGGFSGGGRSGGGGHFGGRR